MRPDIWFSSSSALVWCVLRVDVQELAMQMFQEKGGSPAGECVNMMEAFLKARPDQSDISNPLVVYQSFAPLSVLM